MKALILAAGRGSRLNDITNLKNKCIIEVNCIPLIEYNLKRAVDCKVNEIIIVVGYKAQDIVNKYNFSYEDIPIRYVFQTNQKGLVHAIECSKKSLNGDDFFLMLGDEYLTNSRHIRMVEYFKLYHMYGVCGTLIQNEPSKISKTYNVLTKNDCILRLIEKPLSPITNIQGTGHCVFNNEILDYIKYTPTHYIRGEKELPDLIQCAIDDGKVIKTFNVCDNYHNVNSIEDLQNIKVD